MPRKIYLGILVVHIWYIYQVDDRFHWQQKVISTIFLSNILNSQIGPETTSNLASMKFTVPLRSQIGSIDTDSNLIPNCRSLFGSRSGSLRTSVIITIIELSGSKNISTSGVINSEFPSDTSVDLAAAPF